MKVKIIIKDVQDSIELEYLLKGIRKLRENIYSGISKNFTVKIDVDIEV